MTTIKVEYTPEEAQVLINLLDIACKSAGMQAAEACVHLSKKLQEAAKLAADSNTEPVAAPDPTIHAL